MSCIIKLKSLDVEIFETEIKAAKFSGTIKTMLEDCGLEDEEDAVVPVPNVKSAKDDPVPIEDDENKEYRDNDISTWDADFLNVGQATKFDLILAANYLDIKGLMDVTCKAAANMKNTKINA